MVARMTLFVVAACLALAPMAKTLDVSGKVADKLEVPIPYPRICLLEDTSDCVTGDSSGRFRFVHELVSVRNGLPARQGLEFKGGSFRIHTTAPARARVEWFDMRGGVQDRRDVILETGENDLGPMPLSRGLTLLRVRMGNEVFVCKAVGSIGSFRAGAVVIPGPLAKVAHHEQRTLVFSRQGYRTRYEPIFLGRDSISDLAVQLAASDDSGFLIKQNFFQKVKSLDQMKGKLLIEYGDFQCVEGSRVARTIPDTLNFAWRGGEMLLWGNTSCQGSRLTGAGPDIVGTWNLGLFQVHLPQDLRPPNCKTSIQSRFQVPARIRISEEEFNMESLFEFCGEERFGWQIEEAFGSQARFAKTRNNCRETVYQGEKGESASVAFSATGDTISIEFRFKEVSCRYSERPFEVPEACPDPQDALFADFRNCIRKSGFSPP